MVYVCKYLSVNSSGFVTASSLPIIPPSKIDNLNSPFHFSRRCYLTPQTSHTGAFADILSRGFDPLPSDDILIFISMQTTHAYHALEIKTIHVWKYSNIYWLIKIHECLLPFITLWSYLFEILLIFAHLVYEGSERYDGSAIRCTRPLRGVITFWLWQSLDHGCHHLNVNLVSFFRT